MGLEPAPGCESSKQASLPSNSATGAAGPPAGALPFSGSELFASARPVPSASSSRALTRPVGIRLQPARTRGNNGSPLFYGPAQTAANGGRDEVVGGGWGGQGGESGALVLLGDRRVRPRGPSRSSSGVWTCCKQAVFYFILVLPPLYLLLLFSSFRTDKCAWLAEQSQSWGQVQRGERGEAVTSERCFSAGPARPCSPSFPLHLIPLFSLTLHRELDHNDISGTIEDTMGAFSGLDSLTKL